MRSRAFLGGPSERCPASRWSSMSHGREAADHARARLVLHGAGHDRHGAGRPSEPVWAAGRRAQRDLPAADAPGAGRPASSTWRAFIPGLRTRLAYATRRNPTGRVLYDARRAYLRLPAALALRAAQRELARRHLGLLVFDAYRPYSATVALWRAVEDPAYAAPPTSGSRHNRAAAIDLTLVDLRTGQPLRMPTPYDTFSARASHRFTGLPVAVRRHRDLLRSVMERHGFVALPEEWWHYDFAGWSGFTLLDVRLSAIARVRPRADVWLLYPPLGRLSRARCPAPAGRHVARPSSLVLRRPARGFCRKPRAPASRSFGARGACGSLTAREVGPWPEPGSRTCRRPRRSSSTRRRWTCSGRSASPTTRRRRWTCWRRPVRRSIAAASPPGSPGT